MNLFLKLTVDMCITNLFVFWKAITGLLEKLLPNTKQAQKYISIGNCIQLSFILVNWLLKAFCCNLIFAVLDSFHWSHYQFYILLQLILANVTK
jgi:hypothetical protein